MPAFPWRFSPEQATDVFDFSVWAPHAEQVDLLHLGVRHTLLAGPGGWWSLPDHKAQPGDRYRFSIDSGPPRPDPRSAWQPEGVHGASALVDHADYPWRDSLWHGVHLPGALLYEIHV